MLRAASPSDPLLGLSGGSDEGQATPITSLLLIETSSLEEGCSVGN